MAVAGGRATASAGAAWAAVAPVGAAAASRHAIAASALCSRRSAVAAAASRCTRRLHSTSAVCAPSSPHVATSAHSPAAASATGSGASSSSSAAIAATLLDGVATSDAILRDIGACVSRLRSSRPSLRAPGLAVLLATSSRESARYVERKGIVAARVGFATRTLRFEEGSVTDDELLLAIRALNSDPAVDGILVQLPLPSQIDQARILAAVEPSKDVDCFHPANVGNLALFASRERTTDAHANEAEAHQHKGQAAQVRYHPWERRISSASSSASSSSAAASHASSSSSSSSPTRIDSSSSSLKTPSGSFDLRPDVDVAQLESADTVCHVPCTPKACLELLDRFRVSLRGKHVVVLGRSASVGLPLTLLLLNRCATVTNIDQDTPENEAKKLCRSADVIIAVRQTNKKDCRRHRSTVAMGKASARADFSLSFVSVCCPLLRPSDSLSIFAAIG